MPDGSQKLDLCDKLMVVVDEQRIAELDRVLTEFKEKTRQEVIYREIQRGDQVDLL
jgi:hypothetical protein